MNLSAIIVFFHSIFFPFFKAYRADPSTCFLVGVYATFLVKIVSLLNVFWASV